MNRSIYTMRTSIAGASPQLRAERALERLRALDYRYLALPIRREAVLWEGQSAIALRIEDRTLLTAFARDLDPDLGETLPAVAERAAKELALALAARRQLQQLPELARGIGLAAAAFVGLLAVVSASARIHRRVVRWLRELVARGARSARLFGIDWSDYIRRFLLGAWRVLLMLGLLALAYAWIGFAFHQFLATQPLAASMGRFVQAVLLDGLRALWAALPGLAMIAVIVLVARATSRVLRSIFDGIASGRFKVPGLHADTVQATRRLCQFLLWALAVAALYPYIPGSSSEVFRAVSVIVGFLATFGATSIAGQLMSGIVIVYARALRVGDLVRIDDQEGVVSELGVLSVKLRTYRHDEITLPNSKVVNATIVNYTRPAVGRDGAQASARISIGYDTPWRQVAALLEQAAAATAGVRTEPRPVVLQRSLSDFYVEYELIVHLSEPQRRVFVLSDLHRAIQDAFNAADVQIMSPHFVMQPQHKQTARHPLQAVAGPAPSQPPHGE